MSRMMRSDHKPPLPRSPIRLRSRRNLQSQTSTNSYIPKPAQTPTSYAAKTQLPKRTWGSEELCNTSYAAKPGSPKGTRGSEELGMRPEYNTSYAAKPQSPKGMWCSEDLGMRPEYNTISSELRALAKMVENQFQEKEMEGSGIMGDVKRSPLFERGRLYEEYSARRNERLKRKKGGVIEEKKPVYDLGVRVSSAKKEVNKYGSAKKAVPATPVMEVRQTTRYSLRSSSCKAKEASALPMSYGKTVGGTDKKVGARRARKI